MRTDNRVVLFGPSVVAGCPVVQGLGGVWRRLCVVVDALSNTGKHERTRFFQRIAPALSLSRPSKSSGNCNGINSSGTQSKIVNVRTSPQVLRVYTLVYGSEIFEKLLN